MVVSLLDPVQNAKKECFTHALDYAHSILPVKMVSTIRELVKRGPGLTLTRVCVFLANVWTDLFSGGIVNKLLAQI